MLLIAANRLAHIMILICTKRYIFFSLGCILVRVAAKKFDDRDDFYICAHLIIGIEEIVRKGQNMVREFHSMVIFYTMIRT